MSSAFFIFNIGGTHPLEFPESVSVSGKFYGNSKCLKIYWFILLREFGLVTQLWVGKHYFQNFQETILTSNLQCLWYRPVSFLTSFYYILEFSILYPGILQGVPCISFDFCEHTRSFQPKDVPHLEIFKKLSGIFFYFSEKYSCGKLSIKDFLKYILVYCLFYCYYCLPIFPLDIMVQLLYFLLAIIL